jgi:serine palmitoyltransferase
MNEVGDLLRLKYSRLPRPVGPIIYGEDTKPQQDQVD